jgi:hypothetical protein
MGKKETNKKWYDANRDVTLARAKQWRKDNKERFMLNQAKCRATKKGMEFNLEVEDIVIPLNCPVFDIPLFSNEGKGACPNSPTLDRIDQSKGYIKGNVWVVSSKANTIKSYSTIEELEILLKVWKEKAQEK